MSYFSFSLSATIIIAFITIALIVDLFVDTSSSIGQKNVPLILLFCLALFFVSLNGLWVSITSIEELKTIAIFSTVLNSVLIIPYIGGLVIYAINTLRQ